MSNQHNSNHLKIGNHAYDKSKNLYGIIEEFYNEEEAQMAILFSCEANNYGLHKCEVSNLERIV